MEHVFKTYSTSVSSNLGGLLFTGLLYPTMRRHVTSGTSFRFNAGRGEG